MPDSMRYRLTDDRSRLLDQLRGELNDELPDQRWKADVMDMALTHLLESLKNDVSSVPPEHRAPFNTSVLKHRYRSYTEIQRP